MVIFAPDNDTLHGIKADYDHLITQRTQMYGNFWYRESIAKSQPNWEEFRINTTRRGIVARIGRAIGHVLPAKVASAMQSLSRRQSGVYGGNVISDRLRDKQ